MKKVRTIINFIVIALALIVLIGIIIQIFSPHSVADTTFDIITLLVSVSSVSIAVLSQVSAYRDRRTLSKLTQELGDVNSDLDKEVSDGRHLNKKLDEIIKLERLIYEQLKKKKIGS